MKTKLILLDTPIIVSDELTREQANLIHHYQNSEGKCFRIIAGSRNLPEINFNGFEEQLGIVDVEKLAYEYYLTNEYYKVADAFHWSNGFKAAQKLNEKKFSLEDIEKAIELARVIFDGKEKFELDCITGLTEVCTHNWETKSEEEIIDKLSQPKVFDVEVEMEWINVYDGTMYKEQQPKITDNSIKITKIL